ncbi:MAG: mechanosensitive ion channel family protein [Flavobacteriaceae bacterium]|nr:mechanosensitive ion channel family protein [Flavobacteriaceae bacterium]
MKKIVIIIFLIPFFLVAQEKPEVDLSNPNSAIYTHLYFLQKDSYEPEKAATTIYGLEGKKAIQKAIKIKKILDGKGLFVDFDKVPNNPDYNDTLSKRTLYKYVPFPLRMPKIYVERIGKNWYYSMETVDAADTLYNEVFPWYIRKIEKLMPDYTHANFLDVEAWQWIAILLLLIVAIIITIITKKIVFLILEKIQYYITKTSISTLEIKEVLKQLAHPIGLLFGLFFIDLTFPSLQFSISVNKWVFLSINIIGTVFWFYILLKLVKVVTKLYSFITAKTNNKLDDQLVPIISNLLTGIVVLFGFFKVLYLFGVDTKTILAGATIGGLAFALASQDTVKNFIGTLGIFLDRPFHIGDWIVAGEVTGSVEEVGLRSTRIRAADTTVFQIPNSKLSEMVINNAGVRLFRRYNTTLGIRYDTPPELIEAFVKGIRDIISLHPNTRKEGYVVEFTGFGDSALQIMVNVFFVSLAWDVEQSSKHKLHMAIVKLAHALGVEFAFPSSTLMIEQFPDKSNLAPKYTTENDKINVAIENVLAEFNKENPEVTNDTK